MELIGAICTRKFTRDLHLIKSISKVLKKDILCMYPEARYTPCGTTSFLPDSVGKLIKLNKVPVVVAIHRGNHLYAPFYNFRQKRKVPHHTTLTQILTTEDIKKMSVDEINKAVKEAFYYNDYEYILKEGFKIKESYRAEGLHKVLYKCPHCNAEGEMNSKGSEIICEKCNKRWTVNEDMTLTATEGETKFPFIPDWYEWEICEVEKEILSGNYSFADEVEVYSLPRCYKWHNLGKATVAHDIKEGFVLEGFYRNEKYRIHRTPAQMNSLHVEYDCPYIKPLDCFDISSENDTFYCYPSKKNVITKLAFATEIIHLLNTKNKD
jgi:DNA-directed RNA polymerase subunit RPC12/RpoP